MSNLYGVLGVSSKVDEAALKRELAATRPPGGASDRAAGVHWRQAGVEIWHRTGA